MRQQRRSWEGKGANYALVQELAARFKEKTGSIRCADLLGLTSKDRIVSTPEERTAQYYAKRPCVEMVRLAATIWGDFLEKEHKL